MMGIAPVACFGLMVVGVILYQIDARAGGGFLHPSSAAMANLVLWRWGIVCLIAGVFGWVLIACAEAMRPPAFPRWWDASIRREAALTGCSRRHCFYSPHGGTILSHQGPLSLRISYCRSQGGGGQRCRHGNGQTSAVAERGEVH